MDFEELVAKYIAIRDHIDEAKKELEKQLERPMAAKAKLENLLLAQLNDNGAESVKTAAGTVYRTKRTSMTVEDRKAFMDACREADLWDSMDVRPAKSVIEELSAETGGFPGVKINTVFTVGVRRAS